MRVLFVDDEPGIRTTLPIILRNHGFEVEVASTVAEALRLINSAAFDVLISDLNIGEPGDGFTVVSAMRRTQPECRNMILTGYPGFESALQAIRNQVDDYLVKPTEVRKLIRTIKEKIERRRENNTVRVKPLARILRDNKKEIIARALQCMKANQEIASMDLDDHSLTEHLPGVLDQLAVQVASTDPGLLTPAALRSASDYGQRRFEQDYSLTNLIDDARALERAIYDVIQENLLAVDLSNLLPDLKRINEALDSCLKESLRAYLEAERQAA